MCVETTSNYLKVGSSAHAVTGDLEYTPVRFRPFGLGLYEVMLLHERLGRMTRFCDASVMVNSRKNVCPWGHGYKATPIVAKRR